MKECLLNCGNKTIDVIFRNNYPVTTSYIIAHLLLLPVALGMGLDVTAIVYGVDSALGALFAAGERALYNKWWCLKIKEIRKMKPKDLDKKLSELRLELSKELGNVKMGRAVKNPGKIKQMRKSIAQILTVKRELKKELKKGELKKEKIVKKKRG